MKNYDEVTCDLLERRDRYVRERRKQKTKILCVFTLLCCCSLIAFVGFADNANKDRNEHQNLETNFVADYDTNKIESTDDSGNNNQIYIQKTEQIPATTHALFNLSIDDFISMSMDEVNEYYGVNIFPNVPVDLKKDDELDIGIFKRENGTGEVYWDNNKINYSNMDASRYVRVDVNKDSVPFDFCNLFDDPQSKSIINNVEVGIAQTAEGDLYAEFIYQKVGFRIVTAGLTQDELVAIIESIV